MSLNRTLRLVFGLLLVVVTTGGIIALTTSTSASPDEYSELLRRWEATGGLENLERIAPHRVRDERNAAVLYRLSYAVLDKLSREERDRLAQSALSAPLDVADLVERAQVAVQTAHQAAARPGCVWDPDTYRGHMFIEHEPDRNNTMSLAALLAADAGIRMSRDDVPGALRDLQTMRTLAIHVANHPRVRAVEDSISIDAMTFTAIEQLFRHRELPNPSATGLLAARDYRGAIRRALIAEGAGGITLFGDPPPETELVVTEDWEMERDRTYYLGQLFRYMEWLDTPADAQANAVRQKWSAPEWAVFSRILLPQWIDQELIYSAEIRSRFAQAACELRDYRRTHGEYPDAWTMPADPFSGKALRYRRDRDSFVLWADDNDGAQWRWR